MTPLSQEMQADGFVSKVHIKSLPADAPPDFGPLLFTEISREMAHCGTGKHPLRLEVTISKYKGTNAARTILVGSSTAIEGSAQLVEPGTGAVAGDWDITRSIGGGGVIAAIGMFDSELRMSRAFASDICKKAFGRSFSG